MLKGARKDGQIITSSWHKLQEPLAGVVVKEVLHVPGDKGTLTELYRPEWDDYGPVAQVFHIRVRGLAVSAWHCHLDAVDRIFVAAGSLKLVLFDDRETSPSRGRVNEFHVGEARPALVVIPEGVWHGIQNLDATPAAVINMPTRAYSYSDPDHFRLPADTDQIPYRWWPAGSPPHPEPESGGRGA